MTAYALSTALERLAQLPVVGVAQYGIAHLPNQLTRAHLPALLVLPIEPEETLFQERGKGFLASAFADGAKTVQYYVYHWLLIAPTEQGTGMKAHLPTLITLTDAYMNALKADSTLGGALAEPAQVSIMGKVLLWGETRYYGAVFRHLWTILLEDIP